MDLQEKKIPDKIKIFSTTTDFHSSKVLEEKSKIRRMNNSGEATRRHFLEGKKGGIINTDKQTTGCHTKLYCLVNATLQRQRKDTGDRLQTKIST